MLECELSASACCTGMKIDWYEVHTCADVYTTFSARAIVSQLKRDIWADGNDLDAPTNLL